MPPIRCDGSQRDEYKQFYKHILRDGKGATPTYGAVCEYAVTILLSPDMDNYDLGGYQLVNDFREITIGDGDTFLEQYFDSILMTMTAGERVYIKSRVDPEGNTYKEKEAPPSGQIKSYFKFNVMLKSFKPAPPLDELTHEEKLERAQWHKSKGAGLLKRGLHKYAVTRFNEAFVCLEGMDVESPQYRTLAAQCHLNLALACQQREDFQGVIEQCHKVLKYDEASVKAFYRRGVAFLKLKKPKEARASFDEVIRLEPENKASLRQLAAIRKEMAKEKEMCKKMLEL
jgi:tetratricopeptide (TPR) repeat protein